MSERGGISGFVAQGHDFVSVEVTAATTESVDELRQQWRDELEASWCSAPAFNRSWFVPIVTEAPAFSAAEVAEWKKAWDEARPNFDDLFRQEYCQQPADRSGQKFFALRKTDPTFKAATSHIVWNESFSQETLKECDTLAEGWLAGKV